MKLHKEIVEHWETLHPDSDALSTEQLKKLLAVAHLMDQPTGDKSESCVIFKHEWDRSNIIFIVTARQKQEQPFGYLCVQLVGNFWKVEDVWLAKERRGQGLITNLYRSLTAAGYKLCSGDAVSAEAEKVWKRLGQLGIAKVLDTETWKIEDFSDKPIGDGNAEHGLRPRFFWITEGAWQNTLIKRNGVLLEKTRHLYLSGTNKTFDNGLIDVFTNIVEAEI